MHSLREAQMAELEAQYGREGEKAQVDSDEEDEGGEEGGEEGGDDKEE